MKNLKSIIGRKNNSGNFSCYEEENRTTNAVEGCHRTINTKISAKPSLSQCISMFKKGNTFSGY